MMSTPICERQQVSVDDEATSSAITAGSTLMHTNNTSPEHENDSDGSDTASLGPAWTESTDVPRRKMGLIQVMSLMINQMIGTGIFSTPGYILLLTGSKPLSLVLWAVGGIYTLLR